MRNEQYRASLVSLSTGHVNSDKARICASLDALAATVRDNPRDRARVWREIVNALCIADLDQRGLHEALNGIGVSADTMRAFGLQPEIWLPAYFPRASSHACDIVRGESVPTIDRLNAYDPSCKHHFRRPECTAGPCGCGGDCQRHAR